MEDAEAIIEHLVSGVVATMLHNKLLEEAKIAVLNIKLFAESLDGAGGGNARKMHTVQPRDARDGK